MGFQQLEDNFSTAPYMHICRLSFIYQVWRQTTRVEQQSGE
jgi:hypothetical protein